MSTTPSDSPRPHPDPADTPALDADALHEADQLKQAIDANDLAGPGTDDPQPRASPRPARLRQERAVDLGGRCRVPRVAPAKQGSPSCAG